MKRILLILFVTGYICISYSQSTLIWSKDFNTELETYYTEQPIIQVNADTIKIIGRKNTENGQRLLIVHYNINGDTLLTQTFGNDAVIDNRIIDFKFSADHHVYLLQKEQLEFYKSKIVLQKYNLDGQMEWVKEISNQADTSYTPHSISIVNDTCFFLSAYKEYDYPKPGDDIITTITLPYLYAFNVNGNEIWKYEFDIYNEVGYFTNKIFTHDNIAFLTSYGHRLVKVDLYKNITVNDNTGLENGINNIKLTIDGNLLFIAGSKYRISKTNLDGTIIWTEYYGTNLPSNVIADEIRAIIQDTEGNIYITGRHYGDEYGTPNYSNGDVLTIKYSSSGDLIWENRYEYKINNGDIANCISLKNGYIYVGGQSQSNGIGTDYDFLVLKMDANSGLTKGIYRFGGLTNGDDVISDLHVFDNDSLVLTGLSFMNDHYNWTTQLLSDVIISVFEQKNNNSLTIYPNPILQGQQISIKGENIIEYSIISSKGQIIKQDELKQQQHQTIPTEGINNGLYVLRLKTKDSSVSRKIIIK